MRSTIGAVDPKREGIALAAVTDACYRRLVTGSSLLEVRYQKLCSSWFMDGHVHVVIIGDAYGRGI